MASEPNFQLPRALEGGASQKKKKNDTTFGAVVKIWGAELCETTVYLLVP